MWPEALLLAFWLLVPLVVIALHDEDIEAAPGVCGWCGHTTHYGQPCPVHHCPCR